MEQEILNAFHSGADFRDMDGLFASYASFRRGGARIQIAQSLLRQSAELSLRSYGKGIEALYDEGFFDISYYDHSRLKRVERHEEPTHKNSPLDYIRRLGQIRLPRGRGPLRAVFSARKATPAQQEAYHTQYIISIAIAGTIRSLADWQVNMEMNLLQGYHQGYYKVTELLLDLLPAVQFPQIAAELGRERLNLAEIVEECAMEQSRFLLWVCGHSKGAALMQVLLSRLINERGLKQAIGIGIASPRVVGRDFPNIGRYPILNILSKPDLVGKMGSYYPLGRNIEFGVKAAQLYFEPKDRPEYDALIPRFLQLFSGMTNPSRSLSFYYALTEYLMERRASGIVEYIRMLYGDDPKDLLPKKFLENVRQRYAHWHEEIVGRPIDQALARDFLRALEQDFDGLPLTRIVGAYMACSNAPHALVRDNALTPYAYFVRCLPPYRCYAFTPQKRCLPQKISFAARPLPLRTTHKRKRKTFHRGKLC